MWKSRWSTRERRERAARERSLQCSTTLKIFSRSPNCTFFIKGYPFQLLNCKGWRWVCRHWRRSRAGSYKSTYFWCTQNTTQDSGLNPSWKHGWCKNRSLNWVIVPVQARVRKCAETWKEMQLHKYGKKIWEILVTAQVIWSCKREVGKLQTRGGIKLVLAGQPMKVSEWHQRQRPAHVCTIPKSTRL